MLNRGQVGRALRPSRLTFIVELTALLRLGERLRFYDSPRKSVGHQFLMLI